jgi:hypothetical protein
MYERAFLKKPDACWQTIIDDERLGLIGGQRR